MNTNVPEIHEPDPPKEEPKLSFTDQLSIIADGIKKGVRYDGCTAVPDFDFGADCCAEHDYHYQVHDIPRAEADKRLRQCIRDKGYFLLPWIYWIGVRLVGRRFWNKRTIK